MYKPSLYSQFIYKSRYARYIDKEKRREDWPESVKRYMDFISDFLLDNNGYVIEPELRDQLENAILNHSIMPSMRGLMTAGPAAKGNNIAMYNCLGGETLVTTREYGIVPISTLEGKSVHVIDGNGDWTLANCRCYGEDDLYNITLSSSGNGKPLVVRATANHDWYLRDGSKVKTTDLCDGDSLLNISAPNRVSINPDSSDYKNGVIHGLVYGDGASSYKGTGRNQKVVASARVHDQFIIRLCGKKVELRKYFDGMGFSCNYPKSFNGDPVYHIRNSAIDLKSLPDESWTSDDYLMGFIRGWLATDGTVTIGGQVSISSDEDGKNWLYHYGPRLGFFATTNYVTVADTNFGVRNVDIFKTTFDRRWLTADDFVLSHKKDRFHIVANHKGFGFVKGISYSSKEKVYCFDVPTTHSFVLTKNILTGNCAFMPIDDLKALDEEMAILMSGTGVGFSVEHDFVKNLPELPETFFDTDTTVVFDDSRIGWSKGYREFISILLTGQVPKYDVSRLRGAGARLKTMGGRSSGPEPLVELLKFTVQVFKKAAGRRLTTIEAHDLGCKVADIVVVGGVRRSALISLSDLADDRMREAKSGQWWNTFGYRRLANNSAVYNEKPDIGTFMREWLALYDSKSGERGVFSRVGVRTVINNANEFRERFADYWENTPVRFRTFFGTMGTNPCSEIILRPYQFCNLTSVQIYEDDTVETLLEKIRLATILGTFQSCFTNFKYINKKWKQNCEDERLLGVSLNGIYDNCLTNGRFDPEGLAARLEAFKFAAIDTNLRYAKDIGINSSVAITCVKPEGTTSALNGTSSGIHPAHSPFYIRYVRNDKKDPLTQFMIDMGFPFEKDAYDPANVVAFKFPIKSSQSAVFKDDLSAIEHLELWKTYQQSYCEHKPSITVSVKESEWLAVGAWCYENFKWLSGVSFLPAEEGTTIYKQAPFSTCTEAEYEALNSTMPQTVDWSKLAVYEIEDATTNAMDLACVAGGCQV